LGYPNTPLKILTVEDCSSRIKELTKELDKHTRKFREGEIGGGLVDHTAAQIAVWERVRHHLANGQIITIDNEDKLKMWENVTEA
jgi:hypothetical protein